MLLFKPNSVAALCVLWGSATLGGVRASSSSDCGHDHNNARDDSDDSDDDGDDDDSNSSSSRSSRLHGTATSTSSHACSTLNSTASSSGSSSPQLNGSGSHHGISKGAIAGIVIALLFALFALLVLLLCCRRRHRRQLGASQALESPNMTQSSSGGAVTAAAIRQANHSPSEPGNTDLSPTVPLLTQQGTTQQRLRNLRPSGSVTSLPNPYDLYDPERTLPPAPPSDSSHSDHAALLALAAVGAPSTSSHPPSSYMTDLNRGSTQTSSSSRLSTSSLLHSEIQSYQKRLEAHHEKELAAHGESRRPDYPTVPSDPPPLYTENIPPADANDADHR